MEEVEGSSSGGVRVSVFDYSVGNYLKAIDTISELCQEPEIDGVDNSDHQRISSSVTFLTKWRDFNYKPRTIRFANETGSYLGKDGLSEIKLPQFSSAAVPKEESSATTTLELSKDFIMYVGGSIWALDWCPRVHEGSHYQTKCEFLAVATHPPESYYHKLGVPLIGRGIVQIWCMLNVGENEEAAIPEKLKKGPQLNSKKVPKKSTEDKPKKPRGRPRKQPLDENDEVSKANSTKVKRPRGRPRKKPVDEPTDNKDSNEQSVQPLAVQYPEFSPELLGIEGGSVTQEHIEENLSKKLKSSTEGASPSTSTHQVPLMSRILGCTEDASECNEDLCLPSSPLNNDEETSIAHHEVDNSSGQDSAVCINALDTGPNNISLASCSTMKDVALPRVIFCLAHHGRVAWDVKWQPYNENDSKCKQRMGYLAVLLGNGSLEVWEIPLPRTMKDIYLSSLKEDGTDPRFIKLKPVFRCSKLKCGDRQSIPLTVEWSTAPPHEFLLAGCHDGTVALWKFSAGDSSKDTRPLLCFIADTLPIRAVAWVQADSGKKSTDVIATAGHGGLKFWDLRDPFRPLWDFHKVPRFIYGLDWLPDPRCVLLSYDDGSIRLLSLVKAAYDAPAKEKPSAGTRLPELHLVSCSSFAVWSIQVSRLTGMVAYCSADGTVLHFQLTRKTVEKDFSRHRAPHFLCGQLKEEESTIIVKTPVPDTPVTVKKTVDCYGERPLKSYLPEANSTKSAKETSLSLDCRTPVKNLSDAESEYNTTPDCSKSKKGSKSSSISKKKAAGDLALICVDDEGKESEKGETEKAIESFPPKSVAMHRVRWNLNKGSERWLCYGGAAGIVRCQEIRTGV